MPRVSIVVPLYNKGRTIGRALRSIFEQSVQDFEVVVVDDGSTDNGADIVEEQWRDPRLTLIRQDNLGPGAARNRGLRMSTATHVAFLDGDDELLPGFLEQNLSNLERHPECVLSTCGSVRGAEKSEWKPEEGVALAEGVFRLSRDDHPRIWRWASFSIHISVVASKEVLCGLGGFYENRCGFGEDTYLWLQVILNHPVYREPAPLLWYHTEDAGLNVYHIEPSNACAAGPRPLLPLLTEPERVRQSCPAEKHAALERYLAFEALGEALARSSLGEMDTARDLMDRFPAMAAFHFDYAKLRLKLASPRLTQVVSGLRRRC